MNLKIVFPIALIISFLTFSCNNNSSSNEPISEDEAQLDVDTTPVEVLTNSGLNYQWYSNDEYLTGLKDRDGNILVEAQFECVGGFYNGWAPVWNEEFSGFCDTLGNLESLPPGIKFATYFSEMGGGYYFDRHSGNYFLIANENSKLYGFIHASKNIISQPKYTYVDEFKENLAVVELDSKYGYIDTNGNIAIPLIYDNARSFSEGYAGVTDTSGLFGFINQNNDVLIDFQFYEIGEFAGDLCIIFLPGDSKISFIDKKGNVVIEGPFEDAQPFWGETTLVQKNGKCYYINKKGKKTDDADCDGFLGC